MKNILHLVAVYEVLIKVVSANIYLHMGGYHVVRDSSENAFSPELYYKELENLYYVQDGQ